MAFTFPDSPTEGTLHTPSGGPTYIYRTPAWELYVAASGSGASATTIRNRIINGAMQVSQENTDTAGTINGWYMADQWTMEMVTSGAALSGKRQAAVTPDGSQYRLRMQATTADATVAATDYWCFRQRLEGTRIADFRWGGSQARQVILRFGWKSQPGSFTVAINNPAATRSWLGSFTVPTTDEKIFTFLIPGDTLGAWPKDHTTGMIISFMVAVGSSFHGAEGWNSSGVSGLATNTNGFATALQNFDLFDVGLYCDADQTGVPPQWTLPDEILEGQICRRYWTQMVMGFSGNVTSGSNYHAVAQTIVPQRIGPSLGLASNLGNVAFPTSGTFAMLGNSVKETRVANGTGVGEFMSLINVNARM